MSLQCPYCEYICERKNVLSRHLNKYHLDENDKKDIQCERCGKAFYNLESLRRHLKKRNCESKVSNTNEATEMIQEPPIIEQPNDTIQETTTEPDIIYIETMKNEIEKRKRPFVKWLIFAGVMIFITKIYHKRHN